MPLDLSAILPVDCISEPTAFLDNRSMWCQTFDLTSPEERREEIMYPSIRKLLGTMIRHSVKKASMCKNKQHKGATNPDNRIHNGTSKRLMSDISDDYNIRKLSLCEHKCASLSRSKT
jgi:hypothetical protein